MAAPLLSRRDINILEKIKDPESAPSTAVLIDDTLPKDPNVADRAMYDRLSLRERGIVLAMQQLETEMAGLRSTQSPDPAAKYRSLVSELDKLVAEHPAYASARNNRAQALRRLYGDGMLVEASQASPGPPLPLLLHADSDETMRASNTALSDLDKSIALLSPRSIFSAVSPVAAKTLSMAYTQRAAIYHTTSKLLGTGTLRMSPDRRESDWTPLEFEEAASRDFANGGRYGNEIAKGLAVSTNPTAKLCGEMVREMMKKEYGSGLP